MSQSTSWPPKSLCTVYVTAKETYCPLYASTKISAPASLVFHTLLDTSTYPRWNTWCPNVTIRSQPDEPSSPSPSPFLQKDTHFTLHVMMDTSKPSKITDTLLRVTDISTPENQSDYVRALLLQQPTFTSDLSRVYRIAWTTEGGLVSRGLRSERFHEIIVLGNYECEVRTWECLGGVVARTIKWFWGEALMEMFGVWVRNLKGECERRWGEGQGVDGGEGEGRHGAA
jgi:hypothetical protein